MTLSIDCKLSVDLLRGAVNPVSTAAGIAQACQILARNDPESVMRILANSWRLIAERLATHVKIDSITDREVVVASLFVEQYFSARGDWSAMAERLLRDSPECRTYADHVCERLLQKAKEEA